MSELLSYFQDRQQAMIDLLTAMVEHESPSHDKAAVDRFGAFVEAQVQALNPSSITRYPQQRVGDMLLAKWQESAPGKPILLLMHMDTVFPLGTLAHQPIRLDEAEGKLYGPGVVDMKGGIVVALTALRGLLDRGELPDTRPVWLLFTSDEEIGSNDAEPIIAELAPSAGQVLVLEPATPDGALKIWRKGTAFYRLHVTGRAAHAGGNPEAGVNAIVELAQQITRINGFNDLRNGTSVSVTMIQGGTAGNVIPAQASVQIDNRALTVLAAQQVRDKLESLEPTVPGASLRLELLHQRPPMEFSEQAQAAFAQVQRLGETLSLTIRGEGTGGGSDGNHTAALGVPTLDGLGPQGDGLHAPHEHLLVRSLPEKAALLAAILRDWEFVA